MRLTININIIHMPEMALAIHHTKFNHHRHHPDTIITITTDHLAIDCIKISGMSLRIVALSVAVAAASAT